MTTVSRDDMDYCEGTKDQPHPAIWYYQPETTEPRGEFHEEQVRGPKGHCPVCVVLRHVIPVMSAEAQGPDGYTTIEIDLGTLEVKT